MNLEKYKKMTEAALVPCVNGLYSALILELAIALRCRFGVSYGYQVSLPISESTFVDPCHWQRDGWWRTWHNRKLALNFICGAAPQELAARYHSKIGS